MYRNEHEVEAAVMEMPESYHEDYSKDYAEFLIEESGGIVQPDDEDYDHEYAEYLRECIAAVKEGD